MLDDAIERYRPRYQQRLAARQHDPQRVAAAYANVAAVVLVIEGLQPERGHATLDGVRELERKGVWVAAALLARVTAEVQQRLAQARSWAEGFGKPVRLWLSDKEEAFGRGMAAALPGVPHRYGAPHVLGERAKPVVEADSRAKVPRRRTGRGVRTLVGDV